jgi:hypothetical protein
MLARLQMSVDKCIVDMSGLPHKVFTHCQHQLTWKGKVQGRFDNKALVACLQGLFMCEGLEKNALLKDHSGHTGSRMYVNSICFMKMPPNV